jgi:carbonic anhydrase
MAQLIFEKLKAGNKRFVEGLRINHDFVTQRKEMKYEQNPFAIIMTCSDSRVISEYIFDTGIGDLFIVRTAGNIVDTISIASIEFAVSALGVKFLMIMGHESCGAVLKAIDDFEHDKSDSVLVKAIKPSVLKAKKIHSHKENYIAETIIENVRHQAEEILLNSIMIKEKIQNGELKMVGAYYHFETGEVDFIDL